MISSQLSPQDSVAAAGTTGSDAVDPSPRQAIALISDHGDPAREIGKDEVDGQTVYVRRVGEALAKLGWQVDIFTRKVNPEDPAIVELAPHCRTIRLVAGPQEFLTRDQVFSHMPEFVAAFQKFQSKEGTNYPLVHTNHWMSAWVGMQLRHQHNIQLVHTYHSLGAEKYQSLPLRPALAEIRLEVETQILETATCVVATSPQEATTLRELVSTAGTVEVIPCGTDTEVFHTMPKAEARATLGLAQDEAVLLYVGHFDRQKGLETLVHACAQLKAGIEHQPLTPDGVPVAYNLNPDKLRLVIVGGHDPDHADDSERQRIEALIAELGLAAQTTFVGQVSQGTLPLYYTAADVCVIPSHYEPFGMVALEAMACGTPVVASAVGGLKFTVIPEETGLLVPPQDVEAFAQAIDRILSDELWARKLARQAPIRVQQNFSWTGVAAQLSNLYRRLLAQSISHDGLITATAEPIAPVVAPAAAMTKAS